MIQERHKKVKFQIHGFIFTNEGKLLTFLSVLVYGKDGHYYCFEVM